MKIASARLAPSVLLALALGFQIPVVRAELVATPEVAAHESADADRAKVQRFLDQASVKERLQAMGVDGLAAAERVAALDQEEVHALAQRIDRLPAGGAFTTTEWLLVIVGILLLVIIL